MTTISRQTIKPSSPTPSGLRTYNLSLLDQLSLHVYMPMALFYPNHEISTAHDKSLKLKKSLSQSLTKYYPFAGRFPTPTTPYLDCNDEGVEFLEAHNDSQLDGFLNCTENDEVLDQLFPDGLASLNSPDSTSPVKVQLTHFACGGVVVAVCMLHKIGDFRSIGTFINHWATVARCGSVDHQEVLSINPHFLSSLSTNSVMPQAPVDQVSVNRVTKKFVFPNSKLNELKNKVTAMASEGSAPPLNNPSRVEVLTSLLYKTTVAAATTKSGCFNTSFLFMPVDMRQKLVKKLPQTTVGNIMSGFLIPTRDTSKTELNAVAAEIKKGKIQLDGVENVQEMVEILTTMMSKLATEDGENVAKRSYGCSSLCGFPLNKVDFGWGKPIGVATPLGSAIRNGFILKDTPDGDGIEAQVILEKEHMDIFENDEELLAFC